MHIQKLGHCCLVIEINGTKILTDPGTYSTSQNEARDIDLILITHEHADHLHIESLKKVLENNPKAKIITNGGVGAILQKENIAYELVEDQQNTTFNTILIEGFGEKHADIYPSITPVENTGYFINNELFYPGDAFTNLNKSVKILALPVAGPWLKISDAIDYAKKINPKLCFPVHDGMLKFLGPVHALPEKELKSVGIDFIVLSEGKLTNLS